MSKIRTTFGEKSSQEVRDAFIKTFSYNCHTGEITNNFTGRFYSKLLKKGYRSSVYIGLNNVEYRSTYHRLCWFLHYNEVIPDLIQIDHIDQNKSNNIITNLRLATSFENARNKGLRKDNNTGYKGVNIIKTINSNITYSYFCAIINLGTPTKLARFKNPIHAAMFYDSAARYYFKDFAVCNFEEQYLPPMSIEELRKYKRTKKPLPEMVVKKLDELLEN